MNYVTSQLVYRQKSRMGLVAIAFVALLVGASVGAVLLGDTLGNVFTLALQVP